MRWVTIHNTEDLKGVDDDAEQYTRATYPNENMGSCRVHYYVDDNGAWQNLKAGTGLCANDPDGSAEVSWHSGDGSVADGGNMTSLSIEIIMNESAAHDEKAKDNGARIAAWLLRKHGLTVDNLVTHTYWVNKSAGKSFPDVDKQCTNPIPGEKWCPTYIFASTNADTSLKNWKAFKELVKKYMNEPDNNNGSDSGIIYRVQIGAYAYKANAEALLAKAKAAGFDAFITTDQNKVATSDDTTESPTVSQTFEKGDKVKCRSGVTKFADGTKMDSWVSTATLYVRSVESNGKILLVSTEKTGNQYTGRVNASDMQKI